MKSDLPSEPSELDALVSQLIDEQLSQQQSTRLQTLLSQSPAAVTRYMELMDNHEAVCAIYPGEVYADTLSDERGARSAASVSTDRRARGLPNHFSRVFWAAAAAVLLAVGLSGYFLGSDARSTANAQIEEGQIAAQVANKSEQTIAGHATLLRSIDLKWAENTKTYRDGDVLPNGRIEFDAGVAEFDFFCGATLIVEGPATLDIDSDWSVRVVEGRLRAKVPQVARGFSVQTSSSEIIDLGTEFALDVGAENTRVEVIDGEIELRGGQFDGDRLLTGENRVLQGTDDASALDGLSTLEELKDRRVDAASQRVAQWLSHTQTLAADPRLIAYYPMIQATSERLIHNLTPSGKELDGIVIGPVEASSGRFGSGSSGLDFDRPGSRVRTRLDGEFKAFTFSCWAKIDSLDHLYNALFMADGYENGEPHWQIRYDGCLMFSVMIDDTQSSRHYSKEEKRFVDSAGLARIYRSEPFWDISKSGQWFHLAAVYDPANRQVKQYVNGQLVGDAKIESKYFIDTLRIGASEIGNWGQPFRETPLFAVRNLNGTIDELAVFSAALSDDEIQDLYDKGKPLGY